MGVVGSTQYDPAMRLAEGLKAYPPELFQDVYVLASHVAHVELMLKIIHRSGII